MASALQIKVDRKRCARLRKDWVRRSKDFDKAVRECRRSLSEERVHALRLAGRKCVPVLEVMRELDPHEALWRTSRHLVKGLGNTLGPLRDAQVRQLLLEGIRPGRKKLLRRAKEEERAARPSVKAALRLMGRLPRKALEQRLARPSRAALEELSTAMARVLARRERTMLERKSLVRVSDATSVHRARIALKWYRYLLLAMEPCLNTVQRRRLPALKRVQSAIGTAHDEHLFKAWLRRARSAASPPATAAQRSGERRSNQRIARIVRGRWTV